MRVSKWNQFCYKCYLPLSEAYSLPSHKDPVPKRQDRSKNEKVLQGTTFMAECLYSKTSKFTGRCIRLRSETCFLSIERERGKCTYFVTIFILYSITGSTPSCPMVPFIGIMPVFSSDLSEVNNKHEEPKQECLRLWPFSFPLVPWVIHRQKDTEIFLKDSAVLRTAEVCEGKQSNKRDWLLFLEWLNGSSQKLS